MTDRRLREVPRTLLAVLAVTLVALAARLVSLGWRIAHQDEGRVADWTLHYMRTGTWEYRPIIHGPFIPHVNGVVFTLFGASDFTMRLVPALVGGLLPLSAWLLRDRLRKREVVGVAVVLAANPVLLYYSRFMRSDMLLAGFAFLAFALAVRAIDTGRARYLYASGLVFGLAMATKENVLLYPLCWVGAVALILDHRLILRQRDWLDQLRNVGQHLVAVGRNWGVYILGALAIWFVTSVAFYAPKPALYDALLAPGQLPGVLDRAIVGSWQKFAGQWADPDARAHAYLSFAEPFWEVMYTAALPASLLAVLGFLLDRYSGAGYRPVVAVAFYWGAASVLGYPLVMDIVAAWSNVHAIVPLAIPAGVGLAAVFGRARRAIDAVGRRRAVGTTAGFLATGWAAMTVSSRGVGAIAAGEPVAIVAGILLLGLFTIGFVLLDPQLSGPTLATETLVAGILAAMLLTAGLQTASVAAEDVYREPQGPNNILVQYAQPAGEMQETLGEIERIAATHTDGPDVLFYGEVDGGEYFFYTPADFFRDDERYGPDAPDANDAWPAWDTPAPGWFSRLPFPWYTGQFGADVTSTTDARDLADGAPPVVIAYAEDDTETHNSAADIAPYLDGYERHRYQLYQAAEPIVIFVDTDA